LTTRSDPAADEPQDLVQRRFHAPGPRQLWVADVPYVATWSHLPLLEEDLAERGLILPTG
jgi:transposase InsO family protein